MARRRARRRPLIGGSGWASPCERTDNRMREAGIDDAAAIAEGSAPTCCGRAASRSRRARRFALRLGPPANAGSPGGWRVRNSCGLGGRAARASCSRQRPGRGGRSGWRWCAVRRRASRPAPRRATPYPSMASATASGCRAASVGGAGGGAGHRADREHRAGRGRREGGPQRRQQARVRRHPAAGAEQRGGMPSSSTGMNRRATRRPGRRRRCAVPSTVSPTSARPVKPPAMPGADDRTVPAAGGLGQRQQPGGGGAGDGRAHRHVRG